MAWVWTKEFTSADDGSILTGGQIGDIQSDIVSNALSLTDNQTMTGSLTLTNTLTISGTWIVGGTTIAASGTEINYLDGVTSAIQTQIDSKLDKIPATRGSVAICGASGWTNLVPGTSGYFLMSQGAGADPIWSSTGGGVATVTGASGSGASKYINSIQTTVASCTITVASGKTLFINCSAFGYNPDYDQTVTFRLKYDGSTSHSETRAFSSSRDYQVSFAASAVVTGLSGTVTVTITAQAQSGRIFYADGTVSALQF